MFMKRANNRTVWAVLMVLLVGSNGCARQEPGVEIPLNKIWARAIQGTQDIYLLEPDHFGPAVRQLPGQEQLDLLLSSLSQQIEFAIRRRADGKQPIGPGFVVAGSGREALAAVKEVMEQDQMPPQTFFAGTEMSLFFFTRLTGRPVQLKNVAKSGNTITIGYYFVPRKSNGMYTMAMHRYFAVIPLGNLPAGTYAVDMVQTTVRKYTGRKFRAVSKEVGKQLVCQSFVFTVMPNEKEARNNEQ